MLLQSSKLLLRSITSSTALKDCRSSISSIIKLSQVRQTPSITHIISSFSCSCSSSSSSSAAAFSLPSSSVVDISEYLLNGCNWKEAPKCNDYIGPLFIARTPDGRGRGLYASYDVPAGRILLINNAFATSYNDDHRFELFTKILSILKQSPRALHQYYTLLGQSPHESLEVSDIKLFDPNIPFTNTAQKLEINEERIIHILNVNSFEGELGPMNSKQDTRLNGLWLLPSFINHSCCPNASRMIVGEAMFIFASRDIKAKEEINISYTDSMTPLKHREDNLGSVGYGFRCECKRCVAERSIHQKIEDISEKFHELYDQAGHEVYCAATTQEPGPLERFPACMELSDLYVALRKEVNSFENLTKLQKQWILGGYSSAFLGKWLVSGYSSGFNPPENFVNSSALELVEAMKATVPGMLRTLSFTAILSHIAQKDDGQALPLVQNLVWLAMDQCMRVYGKQRFDVTMKLMEQSANIVPFF